ncbi:MAG: glycosyltransferase [Actinomycetota bacterium]|nr:glycosyltransferase [Actinomycetota bacterium]MDQ3733573.1 glycosyltransferase [Actinomycetota bacterium]
MRIAMVSEHANPLASVGRVDAGGQNVHVAALSAHLARRGHQVTVFTRRDDAQLPDQVRTPDGYDVEHVRAGPATEIPKDDILEHIPAFTRALEQRWLAERFDVIHAHFWMSGLASILGAPLGVPVVQTFHALGAVKLRHQGARDSSPAERVAVETQLCSQVDRVIATCSDEAAELVAMGTSRERIDIVPCGVDVEMFAERPSIPHRRRRLLSVGRLVERKGVADVIDALARLPRDVDLLVAGGPERDALALDPEVTRLRAVAAACGVTDRVHFLGAVPHVAMPRLFASADVVVAVPWYEPFGIVPLEAMACARPVVASAVGGMLDSVVPGMTGELVPPRQPSVLSGTLDPLLANPRRRRALGRRGRKWVTSEYRWESVAQRTERVYESVTADVGVALTS